MLERCRRLLRSLQWGRDQLIAELMIDARQSVRPKSLQWGRDQLIAELRTRRLQADTRQRCFNGAAIS